MQLTLELTEQSNSEIEINFIDISQRLSGIRKNLVAAAEKFIESIPTSHITEAQVNDVINLIKVLEVTG